MFWKYAENLQENTHAKVWSLLYESLVYESLFNTLYNEIKHKYLKFSFEQNRR